ncbi:MAG: hypothetical protein COX62_09150 [Deltaproteobacteria bacterium CG_4_10_14_0_2_um_filter_43_8]|nr:MAG: hypothetical protein COV43_00135 [Deltaproteobacteria bacterium CG11_big_fil_rev_8_21_14_0_20_42_23]PJA18153.1 MAG: hypothetical protein COX62_09150 [Deltaproteobacteria bacterium CG_4_10_14_0_2_um_filter_43_8]PJC64264.1 MAG: hypothetical protein CO021_04475 [Deltaproteobacteria bacterium CG_4_9_14_0_2_um_filter_42_21]
MNQKGFTLIELVLVIAILGILAIAAMPRFLELATSAEQASRDGVIGAVRAGVQLSRANDMIENGGTGSYPAALDTAAVGACAGDCFNGILANGIDDASWQKVDTTTYSFDDGNGAVNYSYTQATGLFEVEAAAP